MRREVIRTKLDGLQTIEWWNWGDFVNQQTSIYSVDDVTGQLELQETIPIEPNTVLCDYCSTPIEKYPVPVLHAYALCPQCFENIKV